ncbi:hypothetical protein GQ600_13864 [Phytophthora cactorum]|nr:hypothetical protein GQ600_13864 [Phytophthora cactorum]
MSQHETSREDQHSSSVATRDTRSATLKPSDSRPTEPTNTMCSTRPRSLNMPRLCPESPRDARAR